MAGFEGLKVLVVGLSKSGQAAAELLVEKGAHPRGTDSRPLAELPGAGPFLARLGVDFVPQSETLPGQWDLIVLSPGVPVDLPELDAARRQGARVIGEVELAAPYLKGPKIGVTGANGKTTTTSLIGHILRECGIACQVGGNIGWPPAAMVQSSRLDQWNVLELSSFQLETTDEFYVEIAVVLNITPDHLDRHHTMEAYTAAKRRIVETQGEDGRAVLNADDTLVTAFAEFAKSEPLWFSLERSVAPGYWLEEGVIWSEFEEEKAPWMAASEVPLRGLHNIENVMAAAAACRLAGADPAKMAAAVRTFPGVKHRLEFVREVRGVRYYNDSKATNVDATLKALDAFGGGLWVILGGKDKGSDYRPLAQPLKAKAKAVLLIGAAADCIRPAIAGSVPIVESGTLEAAVREASQKAVAGDTVLLAPACASFDQFQNYEERGRMFKTFVAAIVV